MQPGGRPPAGPPGAAAPGRRSRLNRWRRRPITQPLEARARARLEAVGAVMKTILICAAILLLMPIVKQLLVFGLARLLGRAVGQAALNQQPDTIRLSPAGAHAWKNAQGAITFATPLCDRGFQDAGTYTIAEMPGVIVRLLAKPEEHFYAAIYEHPQVGQWIDLVTLYQDQTSSTFTTAKPTGLAPRPGHPSIHAPGAGPLALYARARAERAKQVMLPATPAKAVQDFERAYAESIAWRKHRGISACEVAEVAKAA